MKNYKSSIVFEKTLSFPHSSQPFTVRMVLQEYPDADTYVLERLDRYDAMKNPVWLPVDNTELSLAIDTMGEFLKDMDLSNFKGTEETIKENLLLKELLEKVLAFHYKKEDSCIDLDVSGQGERFLKQISKVLFDDFYPEDEIIENLLKKHKKSI